VASINSISSGTGTGPRQQAGRVRDSAARSALHALPLSRAASLGISSQVRPSRTRPVRDLSTPPHCLKKNGTPVDTQRSRISRTHSESRAAFPRRSPRRFRFGGPDSCAFPPGPPGGEIDLEESDKTANSSLPTRGSETFRATFWQAPEAQGRYRGTVCRPERLRIDRMILGLKGA
jgi:hypothetical protein